MAYTTATPSDAAVTSRGVLQMRVDFTGDSGEPLITIPYEITTATSIGVLVKNELARLNGLLAVAKIVVKGTPIAIPADPIVTPPTQDELDRQAFARLCTTYRNAVATHAAGLTDQATVDAALAALKAAFKPGYDDLLRIAGL